MIISSLIAPAVQAAYLLVALGTCAPESAPELDFSFAAEDPLWNHARTSRQLRGETPAVPGFPIAGGVTKSEIVDRYNVEVMMKRNRESGLQCVWPTKVKVSIRYSAEIFVAREFGKGGCGDAETRAHELRHVAVDRQELQRALPRLRGRAAAAMLQAVPRGPTDDAGALRIRELLLKNVSRAVGDELEKVMARIKKRQAEIDTAAEYRRFSRACPGEPLFRR
ncbi:MAG TPA: hypothetical protein VEF76_10780 [Patescibacteria group bacterium]|nr:hypothetical protein [Patescibacteria group bacterium]